MDRVTGTGRRPRPGSPTRARGAVRTGPAPPALPPPGRRRGAANDTDFGLCASIWSGDADLADGVAARLRAGTVWTNAHGMAAMDHLAPMGGWGESGLGVEMGVEGMAAFTRPRVHRRGSL